MVIHLLIALATAAATWLLGWWAVAPVAVIAGFLNRAHDGRAWRVALGAAEGWAILLVIDLIGGPFSLLTSTLGGALNIPGPALLVVTLLLPALLGWSGAIVGAELGKLLPITTPPPRTSES